MNFRPSPTNGLRYCAGAGVDNAWEQKKKPKPEKRLKIAPTAERSARLARLVFETFDTILNIRHHAFNFRQIILVYVFG